MTPTIYSPSPQPAQEPQEFPWEFASTGDEIIFWIAFVLVILMLFYWRSLILAKGDG